MVLEVCGSHKATLFLNGAVAYPGSLHHFFGEDGYYFTTFVRELGAFLAQLVLDVTRIHPARGGGRGVVVRCGGQEEQVRAAVGGGHRLEV